MGGSAKGIPGSEGEESSGQNERTMTSKKFEVRRLNLKCFSNECRVSELHARLAATLRMATSQEGGQEKRVEKECPHDTKTMKSRKGGPLPLQWPRWDAICII